MSRADCEPGIWLSRTIDDPAAGTDGVLSTVYAHDVRILNVDRPPTGDAGVKHPQDRRDRFSASREFAISPVDFERKSHAGSPGGQRFDATVAAATREATEATLRRVAARASGPALVMAFMLPVDLADEGERATGRSRPAGGS